MSNPIVEINEGKIKGKVSKSPNNVQFYTFKGIPYAKPPIGELRFSVPLPPEPWEGIRDATQDCNICAQIDRETNDIVGDEDCLYLNVYTPQLPTAGSSLLPVMIYIHGGGFLFGHGTDDSVHGPDYIIEKDVVVVSFNYRLGILGFLSLGRKEAPGNMGLRDQVLAFKWVQKNITKFGGDSNNVTIFGLSAGAASVEYLLLSPMAKGLFHKAIAQSGSSLLHWAQNNKIKELASKIPLLKGKAIADEENLYKYLRDLSIKDLLTSSMLVLAADKWRGGLHFGFVPTVEMPGDWEPFLSKSTYELLSRGEFMKVPLITGFCTREGLLMVAHGQSILEEMTKEKNFLQHLPFKIDEIEEIALISRLKTIYLEGESKYKENDAFTIDFFTDVDFLGGIYVATKMIAKNNYPVYFYEFSYDGGLNYLKNKLDIKRKGACHGDEAGYLIKSNRLANKITDTDKLIRDRIVEMWTNFARQGDPTPKTDNLIPTKWEPIADTGFSYLHIDDKLTMQHQLYPERTKLYEELYDKYYALN